MSYKKLNKPFPPFPPFDPPGAAVDLDGVVLGFIVVSALSVDLVDGVFTTFVGDAVSIDGVVGTALGISISVRRKH